MMTAGYIAIFFRVKESKTKININSQVVKNAGKNKGNSYVSAIPNFVIIIMGRNQKLDEHREQNKTTVSDSSVNFTSIIRGSKTLQSQPAATNCK